MERFYEFRNSHRFGNAEWERGAVELDTIHCPLDDGHQRAGKRLSNLTVVLPSARIGDVVWTWYSECLITDRVAGLFKEEGFSGYELEPVTVSRVRRKVKVAEDLPRLWELTVLGWGGVAPPESGIKLVESCDGCGDLVYSGYTDPTKLIDPARWDGSDFFMVWPLPRFIFVTQRVRDFVKRMKLKGVKMVTLAELPPKTIMGGLGPGRLSMWMPEERARQLGEPLGIY
jgi:hypothetical protein